MSKAITKQLRLQASLEDKKLKQQLQTLQKELDDMGFKGGDLQNFDKSVKGLNDAASSLKEAIAEMKKLPGLKAGGLAGGKGASTSNQEIKTLVEEITKNTGKGNQSFFDSDRAKYVNLRPGEVFDKEMNKKFKNEMHHEQAKAAFKARESAKIAKQEETHTKKLLQNESKSKAVERKKNLDAAKETVSRVFTSSGMGSKIAEGAEKLAPGALGRAGGALRGIGSRAAGAMAGTAGVAAAGVAAAVAAPFIVGGLGNSYLGRERQLRTQRAEAQQAGALQGFSGNALQGIVEEGGREAGSSGFSGFAGGISQTGSDLFSLNPANWVRALSGKSYSQGQIQSGSDEAESRAAETRLADSSLQMARGLRSSRVDALRGGLFGGGDTLTGLQGAGASRGFSGQETLDQFRTARQFLGNNAAAGSLETMQSMFNQTGTSVEQQASAIETLTGAQSGQGFGAGTQQMQEVLKKGVAAGLDVSKSGQFLKLTADTLQSQQGLGNIDSERLSTSLAESAMGFAGGGDVTSTNLRQAAQLQDQLRKESTSTSGFSGLGNISGLQEVLGGQGGAGTLLALQNLSKDATDEDIQSILEKGGVKGVDTKSIRDVKGNAQKRGLELAGIAADSNLGIAFGGRESGNTSEQQIRKLVGQSAIGSGLDTEAAGAKIAAGRPEGGDIESLRVEFTNQQQAFVRGLDVMAGETDKAQQSLKKWVSELERSIRVLREQTGMQTIRNTGN